MYYGDTFDKVFSEVFEDWEKWETRGTIDDVKDLETAERMVMAEEAILHAHIENKLTRAQRRVVNLAMKKRERVRTMAWQGKADHFKKNAKKKGYVLKYKGQTCKAHPTVPADALGWDKCNMSIMGKKTYGVKVGYIFDVT